MPKNITPQDQWETEFKVPLPGEPRNIGPLEALFQRLLNRTERLKNRVADILGLPWDATPPDTLAGLTGRVSALETAQGGTTLSAHRTAPVLDHPDGSVTAAKLDAIRNAPTITPTPGDWLLGGKNIGTGVGKLPLGPGVNGIPFHVGDGRGVELKGVYSVAHLAGELNTDAGKGRWVRLFIITLDGKYRGARGEIWFGRSHNIPNASSRLAYYVGTLISPEARLALAPGLPASGESTTGVITDAAIVQVEANTYELWVQVYTDLYKLYVAWHHHGAVYDPSKISYAPLQATSLPTPVSGGLNVQWSTLSSSSPSLGWFGCIVQSGSNSNGHYVRYDDGTQVCWQIVDNTNGGYYTWIYPVAFASTPVAIGQAGVINDNEDWKGKMILAVAYSTIATFYPYSATGTAALFAGPIRWYFLAIGRWK